MSPLAQAVMPQAPSPPSPASGGGRRNGSGERMPALAPVPAANLSPAVARIAGFMQNFSVEATRPSDADIAALAVLPRGTRVYISAVPHRAAEESIGAAIRLRAAGLEPVPHVAVRNFASTHALDEFLARLNGEAEVRRVLIIAGDRGEHGPFRSAADAIDSGYSAAAASAHSASPAIPKAIRRSATTRCSRRLRKRSRRRKRPGLRSRSSRNSVSMRGRSWITWRGCALSASSSRCVSGSSAQPASPR